MRVFCPQILSGSACGKWLHQGYSLLAPSFRLCGEMVLQVGEVEHVHKLVEYEGPSGPIVLLGGTARLRGVPVNTY